MQRFHASKMALGDRTTCERIERQAWRVLQQIEDSQVDEAQTRDVAEMLSTWGYFASFWERGLDGPGDPTTASPSPSWGDGEEDVVIPLVDRDEFVAQQEQNQRTDQMAPPRRSSPLDEVLEF